MLAHRRQSHQTLPTSHRQTIIKPSPKRRSCWFVSPKMSDNFHLLTQIWALLERFGAFWTLSGASGALSIGNFGTNLPQFAAPLPHKTAQLPHFLCHYRHNPPQHAGAREANAPPAPSRPLIPFVLKSVKRGW